MLITLPACTGDVKTITHDAASTPAMPAFTRKIGEIDFRGVKYNPWDARTAISETGIAAVKPYTILIYMNGSDLESENGAATGDLLEIVNSGVDTGLVNVVIFTGGTYRWHNDAVPAGDCVIWRLEDGVLHALTSVGLRNMGDAGTLASFIEYGLTAFPADRYGLILWDHGGGSIAGYGHDELFDDGCLTLLEMDCAFYKSGLGGDKTLEFLGFDACLMATVEMAVVASRYARYLIASEDLEPGDGWDYTFLGALNSAPQQDGAVLGRHIADSYIAYYGSGTTDSLTMSVTDLSNAGEVMGALGALAEKCRDSLTINSADSYTKLARRRYKTKTFGTGTRRDGDCDMVDIADMARKLADVYPQYAQPVLTALSDAVIYNRHNSLTKLGGLTAYYIFGGKEDSEGSLRTYAALKMSDEYTDYLKTFSRIMNGGGGSEIFDEQTVLLAADETDNLRRVVGRRGTDGRYPVICGINVCLDKIDESSAGVYYAVPIEINGAPADIIVLFSSEYSGEWKILGTRKEDGYIIQKGLDEIKRGDEISFYYRTVSPGRGVQEGWALSEPVTVADEPVITWRTDAGGDFYTAVMVTDSHGNERFIPVYSNY